MDTLHVATKRRGRAAARVCLPAGMTSAWRVGAGGWVGADVLYIPEKPLQVFSARRGCADRVTSSSASAAYADFGVRVRKEGEREE